MKIHDALARALKDKAGRIMTFSEILQQVRQIYPALKPASILPAEHTGGRHGGRRCQACEQAPIFEKIGHGVYKVRASLPQDFQPSQSVHDKLAQAMAPKIGHVLTAFEIKQAISDLFPGTHLPSIIPGDHIIGGACKECSENPIFERTNVRGRYGVLPRPEAPHGSETGTIQEKLHQFLQAYSQDPPPLSPEHWLTWFREQGSELSYRTAYLLSVSLRERIPSDLTAFSDVLAYPVLVEKLVERLYERCGTARELGRWIVDAWSGALAHAPGVVVQDPKPSLQLETPRITPGECALAELHINNTATGYDALKRSGRNVAITRFIPDKQSYLLGIKAPYISAPLRQLLPEAAYLGQQCPAPYIPLFSPQGYKDWNHQNYVWFEGLTKPQVIQVFQELDRIF